MRTIEYHDTTLRVRYAETDQMGFVYKTMETDDDCHIVVAEAHCRYEKPARYDQILRVRTRIAEWRNRVVKFSYEIFLDEDSSLLATGYTTHVICGGNGRPKALPTKYRNVLLQLNVSNPDRSDA